MKILLIGHGISNDSVEKMLKYFHISYDYIEPKERIKNIYDLAIKAPFIPYNNPLIKKLKRYNIAVITDFELVYWLYNRYIIACSGSNGKTTTVSLIKELLDSFILCGNIGYPIGDAVMNSSKNLIVEASSFELEGTIKFKPDIAILLPINECHLDHHLTFSDYFRCKMKLVDNLTENDLLIYPIDDNNIVNYIKNIKCRKLSYGFNNKANIYLENNYIVYNEYRYDVLEMWSNYKHNIMDSMIMILVGHYLRVSNCKIEMVLKNFKGVKYRLEEIKDGIYNDSKSTNVYSTIKAIDSIGDLVLIAGGYEKNDDLSPLLPYLKYIKRVYLYGMNKSRLYKFFTDNKIVSYRFNTLDEAVCELFKDRISYKILFSPMSASYDQYKNYIERGENFNRLINKYVE